MYLEITGAVVQGKSGALEWGKKDAWSTGLELKYARSTQRWGCVLSAEAVVSNIEMPRSAGALLDYPLTPPSIFR